MVIDVYPYIIACAKQVAPSTMQAIIKTESNGNALAIGLNKGAHLQYQAKSLPQAISWVNYLERYNYNFDIGLGQVNVKNAHKYGYLARDMLDPCKNLMVASQILHRNYKAARNLTSNSQHALYMAISAYNSGNYHTGFNNGYVFKVVNNAKEG